MDMEMRHGLARIRTIVDDETKSIGQAEFFRDLSGYEEQMPQHAFVGRAAFGDAGNDLFRHDEQMNGCLRLDVVKHDALVVFMFDPRGDLAINDALENSFHAACA
jgi:hypothetical protein